MDNKITIGSRGSKLSLAYANKVKSLISNFDPVVGKKIIILVNISIKIKESKTTKQFKIIFL